MSYVFIILGIIVLAISLVLVWLIQKVTTSQELWDKVIAETKAEGDDLMLPEDVIYKILLKISNVAKIVAVVCIIIIALGITLI